MWKYVTYANAIYNITYDKAYDTLKYYVYGSTDDATNIADNMRDYASMLTIENYTDETTNDRIYPQKTIYNAYCTFVDNPTYIIDNIYLGSAFNAAIFETLQANDIKYIVNMTSEISNYFPHDFSYLRYNLYDNNKQSILMYLESAYENIIAFQKQNKGNILVHCYMGASRSATLVIYYIMKRHGYSFEDALKHVRDRRPVINPSFRFTKDLAKSFMESKVN